MSGEIRRLRILEYLSRHEFLTVEEAVSLFQASPATIRRDFTEAAEKHHLQLFIPPLRLCGDNAAMIGAQGYYEFLAGHTAGSDLNAYASMDINGSF